MNRHFLSLVALILLPLTLQAAKPWKAGVAVRVITPDQPQWMAGYASRNKPAESKEHDLHVKALAIEDPEGGKLVLVTSDLCGIPRSLSEAVATVVKKKAGLARERLMLTVSHTHSGPVIADNLADMYSMPPKERAKIAPYTTKLQQAMTEAILEAIKNLAPAKLTHGQGTSRFAVNRRKVTPKGVIGTANPDGPVDHDVPVLAVRDTKDKLIAIVFGYACHNTTLQYFRWCGDYAGFAQINLEAKHKGARAFFWAGCAGDSNPLPRSTVALCKKYGKQLSDAVDDVLKEKMTRIEGTTRAKMAEIDLPLDKLPEAKQWQADLLTKNHALQERARRMLAILKKGEKIQTSYPHYPVQTWHLGDQVTWIALGGEVVVEYSRRIKKELKGKRAVWVTAYANDVMAYIPSERVLKEGGYEGDSSMIYYGLPAKWATGIEGKIVTKAKELAK